MSPTSSAWRVVPVLAKTRNHCVMCFDAAGAAAVQDPLIDRIYEAAFVPQLWPGVLDEICARSQSVSGLRTLFDLTPKEAEVGKCLAAGRALAEIAADLSIGTNTVRTHLRNIFAKTGTSQQSELVALLKGTSLPAASGEGIMRQ